MTRRRARKPFGKQIRQGYKILSVLNTLSILLSGNPSKIAKHFLRKKLVRRAGRLI